MLIRLDINENGLESVKLYGEDHSDQSEQDVNDLYDLLMFNIIKFKREIGALLDNPDEMEEV